MDIDTLFVQKGVPKDGAKEIREGKIPFLWSYVGYLGKLNVYKYDLKKKECRKKRYIKIFKFDFILIVPLLETWLMKKTLSYDVFYL